MKFEIVVLLLGSCNICSPEKTTTSHPRVITPLGTIEGLYNISYGGRLYEAYKGIPYAEPPTGEYRFRIAKSISPWSGVLMAKDSSSPCMQYNFTQRGPTNMVSGSEDCLYLNVYTPIANTCCPDVIGKPKNLLPVIFSISGGDFLGGDGDEYGPDILGLNVTLVTANYRQGALGFLSTEDEIVPGNIGLKDQVIALRWVNDNIRYFGGDPDRVTIWGQSAGTLTVKEQMSIYRAAAGGMSLSGTALNPWASIENPLDKAKKLATVVGCSTDIIQSMVDCLRNRSAHEIVDAVRNFTVSCAEEKLLSRECTMSYAHPDVNLAFPYIPANGWGPSVEKGGGEFTFIDRPPIDIIASGDAQDLPWITGVVSEESLFPLTYYTAEEELFESLNNNWERLAPYVLDYNDTIAEVDQPEVGRSIKQHYLGESPISRTTFNQTVQLMSDRMFVYSSEEAARSQALNGAKQSPVRFYYFSHRGAWSFGESQNGVRHLDDVQYVLDAMFDPTTTVQDQEMQKVMIDFGVSFATDGTPDLGVEWSNLSRSHTDELRYLDIVGPKDIRMKSTSNFGEKNFWRTIDFQKNIPRPTNCGRIHLET